MNRIEFHRCWKIRWCGRCLIVAAVLLMVGLALYAQFFHR